jgi:hypothetical protein
MDLLLREPAGPLIADFKTTARGGEPLEIAHEIQLSSYSYLFRHSTQQLESALEIRNLIKTKTPKIDAPLPRPRRAAFPAIVQCDPRVPRRSRCRAVCVPAGVRLLDVRLSGNALSRMESMTCREAIHQDRWSSRRRSTPRQIGLAASGVSTICSGSAARRVSTMVAKAGTILKVQIPSSVAFATNGGLEIAKPSGRQDGY